MHQDPETHLIQPAIFQFLSIRVLTLHRDRHQLLAAGAGLDLGADVPRPPRPDGDIERLVVSGREASGNRERRRWKSLIEDATRGANGWIRFVQDHVHGTGDEPRRETRTQHSCTAGTQMTLLH